MAARMSARCVSAPRCTRSELQGRAASSESAMSDEDPLPLRLAQAIVARRLAHHAAQCLHDAALGERGGAHVIHGEDGDQEDLAVASGARLVDERRQDARLQQLAQPRPVLRAARVREARQTFGREARAWSDE